MWKQAFTTYMQSSEIMCSGGPLLVEGLEAEAAGGSAEYGSKPSNKSSDEFAIIFWNKEINLINIMILGVQKILVKIFNKYFKLKEVQIPF